MKFLSFDVSARTARIWPGLILILMALGLGCRREQISTYQIPKGSESPLPMKLAAAPAEETAPPQIKFMTPAGWRQETPEGMSLAQFNIGDHKAELSVMSFPGEQASQLNIVNIVRQNAGLPPLTDQELSKVVETVPVGEGQGSLVNLAAATKTESNPSTNSVMVTVFPHGGVTYFFKLSGTASVVESQKPALLEFLKSISFLPGASSPPANPENMAGALPGDMPDTSTQIPAPPIVDGNKPAWDVPAGWHEVPPTEMLLAKFTITNSKGVADVNISVFPGEVGGLLANVNRWRGMVKLSPIAEGDLEKTVASLDVMGGKAMLVDMNGQGAKSGKPTRLVGVIWPRNGQTWFYKLMGDAAVAGDEKSNFVKFVQSVRYGP